jgi:hypothetical protein
MVRYDDPNVQLSALVGILGSILLFVIIVGLQALFYKMQEDELRLKVYTQPYEELRRLDAEQLEDLNSYGWVDQQAGIAHIPIDRAMELTVRELSEPPQAD